MINDYESEARARWGNTDAYREHEQKTKNYTKEKWVEANNGLMAIFAEFAACKTSGASADSSEAQALVAKLQAHITANYYTCTDEINAPLEECERRDVKGLYKAARAGKISDFTGISSPYEEPENPDVMVDTSKLSVEACVDEILQALERFWETEA